MADKPNSLSLGSVLDSAHKVSITLILATILRSLMCESIYVCHNTSMIGCSHDVFSLSLTLFLKFFPLL